MLSENGREAAKGYFAGKHSLLCQRENISFFKYIIYTNAYIKIFIFSFSPSPGTQIALYSVAFTLYKVRNAELPSGACERNRIHSGRWSEQFARGLSSFHQWVFIDDLYFFYSSISPYLPSGMDSKRGCEWQFRRLAQSSLLPAVFEVCVFFFNSISGYERNSFGEQKIEWVGVL